MAHSLTVTAATTAATAISERARSGGGKSSKNSDCNSCSSFPIPKLRGVINVTGGHNNHQCFQPFASDEAISDRRTLTMGLSIIIGTVLLSCSEGSQNACAAARRPPPPPPEEKRDPNVSGVQAKVLASKKRKEALKQSVAKLREKGKQIEQSPKQDDQSPQ